MWEVSESDDPSTMELIPVSFEELTGIGLKNQRGEYWCDDDEDDEDSDEMEWDEDDVSKFESFQTVLREMRKVETLYFSYHEDCDMVGLRDPVIESYVRWILRNNNKHSKLFTTSIVYNGHKGYVLSFAVIADSIEDVRIMFDIAKCNKE